MNYEVKIKAAYEKTFLIEDLDDDNPEGYAIQQRVKQEAIKKLKKRLPIDGQDPNWSVEAEIEDKF